MLVFFKLLNLKDKAILTIIFTQVYTVNQVLFTPFLICKWSVKNLSTTKISESKHLLQDEYFVSE